MPLSAEIVESDSKKERECSSGPVPQKREQGRVCSYCCAHEADELSAFLLLIESDNHYRVDEVMKKSASEVTESAPSLPIIMLSEVLSYENILSSVQELVRPMPSFTKLKNRVHIFPIYLEYMLSIN